MARFRILNFLMGSPAGLAHLEKKEDGIAKENIPEGICTKTLCSGYEKSKKPSGEKLKNSADKHHRIKPRLYKHFHAHTK